MRLCTFWLSPLPVMLPRTSWSCPHSMMMMFSYPGWHKGAHGCQERLDWGTEIHISALLSTRVGKCQGIELGSALRAVHVKGIISKAWPIQQQQRVSLDSTKGLPCSSFCQTSGLHARNMPRWDLFKRKVIRFPCNKSKRNQSISL